MVYVIRLDSYSKYNKNLLSEWESNPPVEFLLQCIRLVPQPLGYLTIFVGTAGLEPATSSNEGCITLLPLFYLPFNSRHVETRTRNTKVSVLRDNQFHHTPIYLTIHVFLYDNLHKQGYIYLILV